MIQIGIDSFAAVGGEPNPNGADGAAAAERMSRLIEEIEVADASGVEVFGLGEHHRPEYLDSAPAVILAAAARTTSRITLTSAVTVLSAADPVRVFQEFATLDLLTGGRVEMTVGRGSFTESFPLFGYRFEDYDAVFAEKLELLLALNESPHVTWQGRFRPPLTGQGVFPRPVRGRLPIWLGVGGSPESFVRAGALGLPLMVAIIGGSPERFRPLVDLYRRSAERAGYGPNRQRVGVHAFGYCADTDGQAVAQFYPGYAEAMNRIGRERGWPPMTEAAFRQALGPHGSLVVGDPDTVAAGVARYDAALGGIDRFDFQMTHAAVDHAQLLEATRLIGTEVIPRVRAALGAAGTRGVRA